VLDLAIRFPRRSRLAALVGAAFLFASGCGGGSDGGSAKGGSGAAAGQAGAGGSSGGSGGSGGSATGRGGAAGNGAAGTGGASATGGSAGRGGTTAGTGGAAGRGGTGGSSAGGSGGMGLPPPQAVLKSMPPGWNLGNSFDATPNETSWGNPTPNQTLIKAVHSAGFNTLRIPVSWTNHLGGSPSYTIDSAWMAKVTQTAQWAIDAGMYVFVNTHHDADGQWITFPAGASAAMTVAAEVKAVWTQIATAFKAFDSRLMLECFNEPHNVNGNDAATQTDLNLYLEACVNAIRGTGGANATRLIMIQPVGASPLQDGIQSMLNASIITDPNLLISIHTYYPTNFGLSTTAYAWGSSDDYTSMQSSLMQELRVWLPTQPIVIGEWGSEGAQPMSSRVAHALAYSQDVTTAGMVPVWWDNGGSGSGSYALFNRTSGAQTFSTIVSAIMTGVKNGQASPNNWATLANP
jgi:endoglucanase